MMNGMDVSAYQRVIDWQAVARAGIAFAYAKATEGVSYVDDYFHANHDAAKASGVPFGAYHFFHPNLDPVGQAHHFWNTINGYQGQLVPFVDVEDDDGLTNPVLIVNALALFNETLEHFIGRKVIIYTSYGFWNGSLADDTGFSGHPLFIAEYNKDSQPTLPAAWTDWVLWQHTSGGIVSGVPGFVDLDRLNASDLAGIRL